MNEDVIDIVCADIDNDIAPVDYVNDNVVEVIVFAPIMAISVTLLIFLLNC